MPCDASVEGWESAEYLPRVSEALHGRMAQTVDDAEHPVEALLAQQMLRNFQPFLDDTDSKLLLVGRHHARRRQSHPLRTCQTTCQVLSTSFCFSTCNLTREFTRYL